MLHVSFQPPNSPFPAILPMIGQMGSFERPSAGLGDVLDLYLHGLVCPRPALNKLQELRLKHYG